MVGTLLIAEQPVEISRKDVKGPDEAIGVEKVC